MPIATINKLPQTPWLKTTQVCLPLLKFRSLKSRYWQVCLPSRGSRGESVSLPFPVSRDHLLSLAHGPFLPCITSTLDSVATFAAGQYGLLLPSYKDSCDYIEPILGDQV